MSEAEKAAMLYETLVLLSKTYSIDYLYIAMCLAKSDAATVRDVIQCLNSMGYSYNPDSKVDQTLIWKKLEVLTKNGLAKKVKASHHKAYILHPLLKAALTNPKLVVEYLNPSLETKEEKKPLPAAKPAPVAKRPKQATLEDWIKQIVKRLEQ